RLAGARGGRCRACREEEADDDERSDGEEDERHASFALERCYYGGDGRFVPRCSGTDHDDDDETRAGRRRRRGRRALASYCELVRAGLHRGAPRAGKRRSPDSSFVADTAQTWLAAADVLLDEPCRSGIDGKASSSVRSGAAVAVVIIVVVFFEVPSSRGNIVSSLYDRVATMPSRDVQAFGRNGEKSCFLLISTIAWSLVARSGDHSAHDAVVRKGSKFERDQLTSVLRPLCDLLSQPALQNVMGANAFDGTPCLSYSVLCPLAHALSPIPSGRDAILSMAQKNMKLALSLSLNQYMPMVGLTNTPSETKEAAFFAVDSLCLLIEKCPGPDDSVVDDCGRAAVCMLTDIITLQPQGEVISWMLAKLHMSARSGKYTEWISRRLLRACFVALLKFVALEQSEAGECSPFFLPENMFSLHPSSHIDPHCGPIEMAAQTTSLQTGHGVPVLLQLAIGLYDGIAQCSNSELVPRSHRLLKPHLLANFYCESKADIEESAPDKTEQLFKEGWAALRRGSDHSNASIQVVIDGIFVRILAQAASRVIQKDKVSRPENYDTDTWMDLNEYIYHAERCCYHGEGTLIQKQGQTFPRWIENPHPSIFARERQESTIAIFKNISKMKIERSENESHDSRDDAILNFVEFKVFHMSLCDIILKLLLQNWPSCRRGVDDDRHHELPIILSVCSVLACKRQVKDFAVPSSRIPLLFSDISPTSICHFLELSSRHLRLLLNESEKKKAVMTEVDCLMKSILDVSAVIFSQETLRRMSSQSNILSSYWVLYCSVADEESSQLLSSFVKEYYVDVGKWADPDVSYDVTEKSFSFLSITSSNDLDYHVRFLRGSFLTSLSQVLSAMPTSGSMASLEEQKSMLEILLQLVPRLCQDLDAGFQGHSGGLTKRLLLLFLSVIDKCIDSMAEIFQSIPASGQYQIGKSFVSVHQAAAMLWDVFQENSLQHASLVKGLLKLCVDKIPTMIERIERVVGECIVESPFELTSKLLDQCCTCLQSRKGIGSEEKQSQNEASSGLDERNAEEAVSTSGPLESMVESIGDENTWPKENVQQLSNRERQGTLSLESLQWAHYCAIGAVNNSWNESYRIIAGKKKNRHGRKQACKKSTTILAFHRIGSATRLHTSLCRIFEVFSSGAADVDAGLVERTDILAQSLSRNGKSNLFSCLERISMTLTMCAKQVLKSISTDARQYIGEPTFCEANLNESVICLLGWLFSVKAQETTHDFVTGSLLWFAKEKSTFDDISAEKSGSESYPILSRLPKIMFRLECLEVELRKIDFAFAEADVQKESVTFFDELVCLFAGAKENDAFRKMIVSGSYSFRELLRQSLGIIESRRSNMKLSEVDGILSLDDNGSDAHLERDDFAWTRKRKRRRHTLRSRNLTVDSWLAMDDEQFGSTPGETYNTNDAFVDLEDFLVEG
ncbi:hypothetical protein ACHAWF_016611, partial [Thalassiosira exigua]